jgi:hypothetical protein
VNKIRIPEKYQQGLLAIARLSDSATDELFSTLESIPLAIQQQDAVMRALNNVTQISSENAREIVSILFSIYSALAYSCKSIDVFVEELNEWVDEWRDERGERPTEELKELLREKLTKLLSVPSISLVSKAAGVLFDCDNILKHARVLTDIRPVFGYGDDDSVLASVIVQTLKLEYVKDDEKKEFFVNLDGQDIDNLIAILQRAKRKAVQSENLLKAANVPCIPMVQQ